VAQYLHGGTGSHACGIYCVLASHIQIEDFNLAKTVGLAYIDFDALPAVIRFSKTFLEFS